MDVEGDVSVEETGLKAEQEQEVEKEQKETVTFFWNLQELSRTIEAIEEHIVHEDETSTATEKDCMCHILIIYQILYLKMITCLVIHYLFFNECLFFYSLKI